MPWDSYLQAWLPAGVMETAKMVRFEWQIESGNRLPKYIGCHSEPGASDSRDDWFLWKFTTDGSGGLALREGWAIYSWTDRANADWA